MEGASQGRGRGRQVVGVAKSADVIIVMIDATKSLEQKRLLEIELDAVGIRLNKSKPDGAHFDDDELRWEPMQARLTFLSGFSGIQTEIWRRGRLQPTRFPYRGIFTDV